MNEQFYKIVSVSEYDIQILIFFIKNVKQFFSNLDSKIHILALLQVWYFGKLICELAFRWLRQKASHLLKEIFVYSLMAENIQTHWS